MLRRAPSARWLRRCGSAAARPSRVRLVGSACWNAPSGAQERASSSVPAARMRTASRPALRAPPIETVATGTPGRHLHDRQQRVHAVEVLQRHRHADHRQRGDRGEHPGQVGRAPGAGDDHPQPAAGGAPRRSRSSRAASGARRRRRPRSATPNSSSASAAASITGQSESRAHDDADRPARLPLLMSLLIVAGRRGVSRRACRRAGSRHVVEVVAGDGDVPDLAARAARPCRTGAPCSAGVARHARAGSARVRCSRVVAAEHVDHHRPRRARARRRRAGGRARRAGAARTGR